MFKGSKIEYKVNRMSFDPTTEKYDSTITGRYTDITIKADTEEEAELLFNNLRDYIKENCTIACEETDMGSSEQFENYCEYYNTIIISDREEYDELKELYKEWKKTAKEFKSNQEDNAKPTITEVTKPIQSTDQAITDTNLYHPSTTPKCCDTCMNIKNCIGCYNGIEYKT